MQRREFMRAASGVAAASAVGAGATGTAVAQEEPDWPDFVQEAPNFQTTDLRGQDEVTVSVGAGDDGLLFDPSAIWIDPGTTVTWEWTGEGGDHDVTTEEDASTNGVTLASDLTAEAGFTYEFTFDEETDGSITAYYCAPHIGVDMKGGVAVGDVPTVEAAPAEALEPGDMGVAIREHYVGVGAILAITVSLIFTFYVLKYGESPHASGGSQ